MSLKALLGLNKPALSKEEAEEQQRLISANDFINVRDIRGNFLYSKDGYIFAYLKIEPVSLDLLSQNEKLKKVKNFAAEFSSERQDYKLFSIARPVDISHVTAGLSNVLNQADEAIQKDLLKQEIRAVSDFAISGEVIERNFYMVIWESQRIDGENYLLKRAWELVQKFANCEIRADLADQASIVQLCNLFANPSYAHLDDGDFDAAIPFLNLKGGENT